MPTIKIQILFKILLAAVWLMSGDSARAVDLSAARPSVNKGLPTVNPQHYWFSRRGSWLAIYPNDASTLRLYYSYWSGGWDEANWINIRFLRDGKAVEFWHLDTDAYAADEFWS